MTIDDAEVEQEILQQVAAARSVAPRDVAIAVAPSGQDWRSFLSQIKRVSCRLTDEGRLVLIRKRKSIAPSALKGVYRLASPENFEVGNSKAENPEAENSEAGNSAAENPQAGTSETQPIE